MDLISVIIPVYNVAPYLRKCLDSVLVQTYPCLEILLVDDGSIDDSGKICDEYSANNSIVHVVHQPNAGVSSARNYGMTLAKGEYVTFVDSDDIVEPDMLEVMYKNAKQHNVLLSCCLLDVQNINGEYRRLESGRVGVYTVGELLPLYFTDQFVKNQMYGTYNKLFHKSLISNVYFKNYKLGEDILFVFEVLLKCNRVYISDYIGYHYLHRENSAMTSPFSRKRLDYIYAGEEMLNISRLRCNFVTKDIEQWLFVHIINTLQQIKRGGLYTSFYEFYQKFRHYLIDNRRYFLYLNIARKLDYISVVSFPTYVKILTFCHHCFLSKE